MTDAWIEAACRKLAEMDGRDPDELWWGSDKGGLSQRCWETYRPSVMRWEAVRRARDGE